jgi:tetratricopeptide (TPR) repeat protein
LKPLNSFWSDLGLFQETWKREIATLKKLGKLAEAIATLQAYLQVFGSDKDAWNELSQLYISLNEYSGAKYALEELILLDPRDHYVLMRYAEVLCTFDLDKYAVTAREYYCLALETNPLDLRGLYGLIYVSFFVY